MTQIKQTPDGYKTCPRCKGKGWMPYNVQNGVCFKCQGFGYVNPDGSKVKTEQQKHEEKVTAEIVDLVAKYENDPRFIEKIEAARRQFSNCLDYFEGEHKAEIARRLFTDDTGETDPATKLEQARAAEAKARREARKQADRDFWASLGEKK